jgi:hypothetical protein
MIRNSCKNLRRALEWIREHCGVHNKIIAGRLAAAAAVVVVVPVVLVGKVAVAVAMNY